MAQQVGWSGLFRTSLKASSLIGSLAVSSRILLAGTDLDKTLLWLAALLLAAAGLFAVPALARRSQGSRFRRLFAPDPSRLREALWVLSFFAFTDPGEVSWHAVDQAQGKRPPARLTSDVLLYLVLVFPATLMLDWLFARGLRLTLTAAIYFGPWAFLRALVEAARSRAA